MDLTVCHRSVSVCSPLGRYGTTYRGQIGKIASIKLSCHGVRGQPFHPEGHPEDVHSFFLQCLDRAGIGEDIIGSLFRIFISWDLPKTYIYSLLTQTPGRLVSPNSAPDSLAPNPIQAICQWMIRNIFWIHRHQHLKGEALFAWLLAGAAAADPTTAARRAIWSSLILKIQALCCMG